MVVAAAAAAEVLVVGWGDGMGASPLDVMARSQLAAMLDVAAMAVAMGEQQRRADRYRE